MANIVFQHNQPLKVATVNNGKKKKPQNCGEVGS